MNLVLAFSERLKELIADNNITIEQLGRATECSNSSIYEWTNGKAGYLPSLNSIIKLADYFKCSVAFLVGIDEENYLPNPSQRPAFSKWFRHSVESKGYKIYSLHRATKISTGQLYKWINGVTEPSLDSLLRIASTLNCSIDYLIGREK